MSDIIVVYNTRSGSTKAIAEEIAKRLEADIAELEYKRNVKGFLGYWNAAFDTFIKRPNNVDLPKTRIPLAKYDHLIMVSPVWVETLSTPMLAFCNKYGPITPRASLVVVHSSEKKYEKIEELTNSMIRTPLEGFYSLQSDFLSPDGEYITPKESIEMLERLENQVTEVVDNIKAKVQ